MLGLPCRVGFSLAALRGLLTEVASLVAEHGPWSTGSVVVVHRLELPVAHRLSPDQGSNPCPLAGRKILIHCTTNEVSWWYQKKKKRFLFFSDSTTRCPSMDFFFISLFCSSLWILDCYISSVVWKVPAQLRKYTVVSSIVISILSFSPHPTLALIK